MLEPQITQIKNHRLTQIIFFFVSFVPLCLCGHLFSGEFIYDPHGKKDPFSSPVISSTEKAGTEVLTGIRLEGIIWDEKKPIAVINDKVIGIGDEISGAVVVEIRQNEVIFDVNGQKVSLKLRLEELEGQPSTKQGEL